MLGHPGVFNLQALTTAHREAVMSMLSELDHQNQPQRQPLIVVTDGDDYD